MTAISVVELINRDTMRASVQEYAQGDELTPAEKAAVISVFAQVCNQRILDVGVGGGRTVRALRQYSRDYVGIDYVEEMVAQCRARFPFVRFDHVDARSMPQYAEGSFDVVFFAMNGLCMSDHSDRLRILREVRRVLSPNGVFIFSTYNRASRLHDSWFTPPDFAMTSDAVEFSKRVARYGADFTARVFNRARYLRHEVRGSEYSIINDRSHNYRTMLYYISLENQRQQLRAAGFKRDARVFDLAGNEVVSDTTDDSMTFVARPAKELEIVQA